MTKFKAISTITQVYETIVEASDEAEAEELLCELTEDGWELIHEEEDGLQIDEVV